MPARYANRIYYYKQNKRRTGTVGATPDRYDENDRLTKAVGGIEKEAGILRPDIVTYKSSYTYDAIGNILNKTQSVNGQASATLTHNNDYQYTIDKPHAVTKAGNMLYTYDANGNMLTRENTKTKTKMTLVWDNENRLKQSIDSSYTTDYRYDANGERILKSSDMGELEYVSASYVVRNGTIVSKHVFAGNGRVASTVGNLTDEGKTTTNSVLYYHPDHLGSSSYVTDKQGRFYEAIEYLPYGETLYNERTESDGVSYKYTGKEEDAETGLYYYGARYYDAKLCRWLSVDPILEDFIDGERDSGVYNYANLNLYLYCVSNPINATDPDGLTQTYGADTNYGASGKYMGLTKPTDLGSPVRGKTVEQCITPVGNNTGGIMNSAMNSNRRIMVQGQLRVGHAGIDNVGDRLPLQATTDGRLRYTQSDVGAGNLIRLDIGGGVYIDYMHTNSDSSLMALPLSLNGKNVKAGTLIGYSGTTGASQGPHLHYQVWKYVESNFFNHLKARANYNDGQGYYDYMPGTNKTRIRYNYDPAKYLPKNRRRLEGGR